MTETLFSLPEENQLSTTPVKGQPRLEKPNQQQIEMRYAALDDLLPKDHRARFVWDLAQMYDLTPFYARIGSLEGGAGVLLLCGV